MSVSCGTVALMVHGQFFLIFADYGPQISEKLPKDHKGYGSEAPQISEKLSKDHMIRATVPLDTIT